MISAPQSIIRIAMAASLLLGSASTSATAAPAMSLPDCIGTPQVRPSQLVFACGDGNFSARKLQWTGWGEKFAAAVGTAEVNDCTPNCAAGKFHSYRVILVASGQQTCPNGRPAYSTVEYAFVGTSPIPAAQNSTVQFPCGPRK